MDQSKPVLDEGHRVFWQLLDNDTIKTLSADEISFINAYLGSGGTFNATKFPAMMEFRNSKINEKIANIHMDAAVKAEKAAQETAIYSKRVLCLTVVLAATAVLQVILAIAILIQKYI
jgi:hypothetical protein